MSAIAPALSELLDARAIRIGVRAADWPSAVRRAGETLTASGATTAAYTDEMIATVRKLGPYMVIAPGIALVHARPSAAVLRAGMSLVTLETPVAFGHRLNDPVRLVVALAAPDEEGHVAALATLAEFLSDEARQRALMAARTADAVHRQIVAFERDRAEAGSAAEAGLAKEAGR